MTGRPTAAPPYFPYDHPSMAVVMVWEGTLWKNCGHERTPENTVQHRRCRVCWNAYQRAYGQARYERERRSVAR